MEDIFHIFSSPSTFVLPFVLGNWLEAGQEPHQRLFDGHLWTFQDIPRPELDDECKDLCLLL